MTHPFPTRRSSDLQQAIFIADSTVNERPSAEMLADIAERTAQVARRMGHEPRVAFLSYSTFGNPAGSWLGTIRDAVHILDERQPAIAYEGAMVPDVAMTERLMKNYPFCRPSAQAHVQIGRASCWYRVCPYA